jgi:hypothetical protein
MRAGSFFVCDKKAPGRGTEGSGCCPTYGRITIVCRCADVLIRRMMNVSSVGDELGFPLRQ